MLIPNYKQPQSCILFHSNISMYSSKICDLSTNPSQPKNTNRFSPRLTQTLTFYAGLAVFGKKRFHVI